MPATPDAPTAPELPSSEPGAALPDAPVEAPAAPAKRARAVRGAADAVCLAAVDLAAEAARDVAGAASVGDHEGAVADGERVVTHSFACRLPGYRGWRWAVTVARASRARVATVSEVVLLPGTGALLPPAWVPWSDRVAPGDLGPHDQLPYRADDPYLEPGYAPVGTEASAVDSLDPEADDDVPVGDDVPTVAGLGAAAPLPQADADRLAVWELGLGRRRVLSREGREAAASRWYSGEHGPQADTALHAPAPCASCGYFLPMGGALRQLFGVCANAWSPDDGKVVSLDHGCGAHSETDVEHPEPEPLPTLILDETGAEAVVVPPRHAEEPVAEAPESQPEAETPAEQTADDQA
ncbi:MAG: DUF3027 domain-containing protein [Kineosporiaceae bacterium]